MKPQVKTMARTEWAWVGERRLRDMPFEMYGLIGRAGLLRMDCVNAPFSVSSFGEKLVIARTGYTWLQIAPENARFWATVMFDERARLFQYYFDITLENHILPDGESWFVDGYLDVVMRPGGQTRLLDRDELDAALKTGAISARAHHEAATMADALTRALQGREKSLALDCARLRDALINRL